MVNPNSMELTVKLSRRTVCGVVKLENMLAHVPSLAARYKPEREDIVVGRVIEVAPKRWKVDINDSHDAVLTNIPDGIQRRRIAQDELNMRTILKENDVICAVVGDFQHDRLHLQVDSQKYGKLGRGQMLNVPPYLVEKRPEHFHNLEKYGIDLILCRNGFIWVGEHVEVTGDMVVNQVNYSELSPEEQERSYTPQETRENIYRTANAIHVLSSLGFSLRVEQIMNTVELSISLKQQIPIHEMLGAEFYVLVAEKETARRWLARRLP